MTKTEMITDFQLGNWDKEGVELSLLLKEINKHCGQIAEEYAFSLSPTFRFERISNPCLPARYCQLIAFAVEGSNEGYYVHVGALLQPADRSKDFTQQYMEFGCAKTYSAESAYTLAKEAQRFLTAARWN
jgi:hypothetical protein